MLKTGSVARRLGISAERLRQLDTVLQPQRGPDGRRLYDPALIAAYEAMRAARRAS